MKQEKIRKRYAICSGKDCGLQECVNESRNNLEIKKNLDFVDVLDVLISTYFFSKNKLEMCVLKLMMLKVRNR